MRSFVARKPLIGLKSALRLVCSVLDTHRDKREDQQGVCRCVLACVHKALYEEEANSTRRSACRTAFRLSTRLVCGELCRTWRPSSARIAGVEVAQFPEVSRSSTPCRFRLYEGLFVGTHILFERQAILSGSSSRSFYHLFSVAESLPPALVPREPSGRSGTQESVATAPSVGWSVASRRFSSSASSSFFTSTNASLQCFPPSVSLCLCTCVLKYRLLVSRADTSWFKYADWKLLPRLQQRRGKGRSGPFPIFDVRKKKKSSSGWRVLLMEAAVSTVRLYGRTFRGFAGAGLDKMSCFQLECLTEVESNCREVFQSRQSRLAEAPPAWWCKDSSHWEHEDGGNRLVILLPGVASLVCFFDIRRFRVTFFFCLLPGMVRPICCWKKVRVLLPRS